MRIWYEMMHCIIDYVYDRMNERMIELIREWGYLISWEERITNDEGVTERTLREKEGEGEREGRNWWITIERKKGKKEKSKGSCQSDAVQ